MEPPAKPAGARGVWLVAAAVAGFLLLLASRYGPHRDELYFASAAHRLAWGYPDQPSLVVISAWLSDLVAPHDLVVLRLPSIALVAATVVMTAAIARVLGGRPGAQVLAAATVGTGAVTMFLGHRLTTQTFDLAAWTGVLLAAAYALIEERPRLWLVAGVVAGLGLNAKHDVVVCLLGLLVGIALTRSARHHLRTPWLWAGGVLALLLWAPNLVWQAEHEWPVFTLAGDITEEYGGLGARALYVAQALLIFSPLMSLVWLLGLGGLLRRERWNTAQPLAWVFVVTFALFLATGGKAYYLVGAVPALLAAGSVLLAERWSTRRLTVAGVVLALSAAAAWPAGLPLLPPAAYASSFYPAIDEDQLETIGWPQFAGTVREVLDTLPADQRSRAVVFTGNYGEAGALEWYDVGAPVYSGHNGWGDWGPPPDPAGPVVVTGYRAAAVDADFTGCRALGRVTNPERADNEESGGTVFLCRGPRTSWAREWPVLRHLDA